MDIDVKNRPLLILAGPTAIGKSSISIALAKELDAECVSADSIQVYRGLDIGSAKIRQEEMQGIPHHLIDVFDLDAHYNTLLFQSMAREAIDDIYSRGKLPILVGGTGFYIQALLYGIQFSEEDLGQQEIRTRLEEEARSEEGRHALYERLREVDERSTEMIHPNNIRRIIRALEYYEIHHKPISLHNEEERKRQSTYNAAFFVLTDDREKLYERINSRVDNMMREGLLEEVQTLYDRGLRSTDSVMQGIAYKEMLSYIEGQYSLEDAVELIKKRSRNYAKRQLTWFRREREVSWIDISSFHYERDKITQWIIEECMKKWA